MALDLLQRFLGEQPERQQDYADFLRRYQHDPSSISDEEAARRYRELMRNAPRELAEEANDHAFGQLDQGQRRGLADLFREASENPARAFEGYSYSDPGHAAEPRSLGEMARQAENHDPELFDHIFGQHSPLSSPVGRAVIAAGAAYLASRVLDRG
ncbi:MAG: hypothetical protein OHK0022_33110 [Roseiflexaceae bacterium]